MNIYVLAHGAEPGLACLALHEPLVQGLARQVMRGWRNTVQL